ncbi:MAG: xylulose kinase [Oscillospiraceae bacterium]|nr:xylulose kinase [Oscillospiraceae bacterium]
MTTCYLGIDFGTTGVRAGIYDKDGQELGYHAVPYPTDTPQAGRAEQNPADWWAAMGEAVRTALQNAAVRAQDVASLAVDFHSCSVMLCDAAMQPLRPCIIWMDVRAAAESDEINEKTGQSLSPEWMPAKLLWLKRHESELYHRAAVFCEAQDWMHHRLTGRLCANINNAVNWAYNADDGCFNRAFYEAIGMPEAPQKFPQGKALAVGDIVGPLLPEAAAHLGLQAGIPVACGGIDSSVGILGMGIAEEGQLALVTGSSTLAMVLTKSPLFNPDGVNSGPHHLLHGYYTDYRGQTASGSVINWVKREFCRDLPEETAYITLNAEAARVPVGSDGLLLLDYFQGNKHPYLDGSVRGMIYGLSLSHTRAHIFRAAMEGVCYGTAHLLQQFAEAGRPISEIHLAGGFANSPLLLSIMADICGVPVIVPENPNCSCLGSGIIAATAAGAWPSLAEAAKNMSRPRQTVLPNEENRQKYAQLLRLYLSIYPQFKGFFAEVAKTFRSFEE